LRWTILGGFQFFLSITLHTQKTWGMRMFGLGYLQLWQSASTLFGRSRLSAVKLSQNELGKAKKGQHPSIFPMRPTTRLQILLTSRTAHCYITVWLIQVHGYCYWTQSGRDKICGLPYWSWSRRRRIEEKRWRRRTPDRSVWTPALIRDSSEDKHYFRHDLFIQLHEEYVTQQSRYAEKLFNSMIWLKYLWIFLMNNIHETIIWKVTTVSKTNFSHNIWHSFHVFMD